MEINYKKLNEMKEEVKHIVFFQDKGCFSDDFVVINDFEEALYLAYDKIDYNSEFGDTWTDIREEMEGTYPQNIYQEGNWKEIFQELSKIDIENLLEDNIFTDEAEQVYNDICYDLELCLKAKLVSEMTFFEKMYFAYINGAWPCGLSVGDNKTKLIIYVPRKE